MISIGGGKGGVGKSIVAGNLAVAFAQMGLRVVLVDADLGAANQHTLLGVDRASTGLLDFLERKVETLSEATSPTNVENLRLVVGTGAVPNAANISHAQKQKLMRHIRSADADVVVIDVGAGSSHNTVDFFDLGDARVLVVTAQLTSIQNAYGFLKAAVLRLLKHACVGKEQIDVFDASVGLRETERIDDILSRVAHADAALEGHLRDVLASFDVRLVGNQVAESQDMGIFRGVGRMVRDFLAVPLPLAGFLSQTRDVHESVNRRTPVLLTNPHDENARALRAIAESLLIPLPSPEPRRPPHAGRLLNGDEDVAQVLRRHPRLTVDWVAAIEQAGRITSVRVIDVSAGGVGIVTRLKLTDGDKFNLILNQPQLKLTVPTVVRNVEADGTRVGLSYVAEDETPLRILKVARADLTR
ncbi:MAG: P-loop NTPase [Deltaproteobacteria bacterium]|nr:P-loop NTPase [Deltaproteobacteria bacterium]